MTSSPIVKDKLSPLYLKHRSLLLYGIIGAGGATLDFIIYLLLVKYLEVYPPFASFISVSFGIINNYLINAHLNFKRTNDPLYRFAAFYSIGALGALTSALLIWILTNQGFTPAISKAITIIPIVIAQYIFNKSISFRSSGFSARFKRTVNISFYALPIIVGISTIVYIATTSALGYDDSYNLQVSQNLASNGIYATNGANHDGQIKIFDYYISTGPTLLMPIALAIKLSGNTIFASRIIPILTLFILLFGVYLFLKEIRLAKKNDKLTYSAFILASALIISALSTENLLISSVGEVASITFILYSFLLLAKGRPHLSGLLLGLAILTKVISAIVIPITILMLIVSRYVDVHKKVTNTAGHLIFAATPLILFEIYRLYSFRFNFSAYKHNLYEHLHFFKGAGSGVNLSSTTPINLIGQKIETVASLSPMLNNPIIIVAITTLLSLITYTAVRLFRKISLPTEIKTLLSNAPLLMTCLAGFVWTAWWGLASDFTFIRHLTGAIVFGIIFMVGLTLADQSLKRYRMPLLASLYVTGLLVLVTNAGLYDFQFGTISEQKRSAAIVDEYYGDKELSNFQWWQNPEMQYLLNTPSKPYDPNKERQYVLMSSLHKELAPTDYYLHQQNDCKEFVTLNESYSVCITK